jgi:formylglycine-generating enzyme required for sulfatase activity
MKRLIFASILLILAIAACSPSSNVGSITPPHIDTGVDSDTWATVPAGAFPYGMHDHPQDIDYDYEIMITDVTVDQYANYLNESLASGKTSIGAIDVNAGYNVADEEEVAPRTVEGVGGYYPGDRYDGYKHEMQIKEGTKLYVPIHEDGLRLNYEGETFTPMAEYANHPMTMVSWYGANAYCEFYGWRLPTDTEWEKAARGSGVDEKGHGRPFPWGQEILPNNANYYSSFDLFEKIYGKLGNTTPVGLYNGKTYDGYETLDSPSPYGLYDMAGNVWQWVGDDFPDMHYRYMRGGSFYSYEVDLRTWKVNSAGPEYYSPSVGFRCARDK